MNYIIKLLICLLITLVFSGCAITHKFGPFIGKVVDAETEEPIEGAAVHIWFYTVSGNPGGISSSYAGFVECLTDKNGEFNLVYRVNTFRILNLWDKQPRIVVFKPGYGTFPGYKGTSITPKPEPDYYYIEEGEYGTIRLPKLKTDEQRRESYGKIYLGGTPIEDQQIIRNLENQERIHLGFKPYKSQIPSKDKK